MATFDTNFCRVDPSCLGNLFGCECKHAAHKWTNFDDHFVVCGQVLSHFVIRGASLISRPSVPFHILTLLFWLYSTAADRPEHTSRYKTSPSSPDPLLRYKAGYRQVLWHSKRTWGP